MFYIRMECAVNSVNVTDMDDRPNDMKYLTYESLVEFVFF